MASRALLNLPLAPSLPQHLKADEATPSVQEVFRLSQFGELSEEQQAESKCKPSFLRRSRPVNGHFSYVTPLPIEFPFGVPDSVVEELQKAGADKIDLEQLLARYEPSLQHPVHYDAPPNPSSTAQQGEALTAYTSPLRGKVTSKAELFGLSRRCLQDCLPDLDVGDAFEVIKNKGSAESSSANPARQQLVDVLSGNVVAAQFGDKPFAPWSLCYGGHQFGSWASQLGDGRAISILTTPAPSLVPSGNKQPPQVELQLKGAGRTPYSRFADGLAVLRSSVREFLGSEAVAALDVPTSRALSLIHLPDIEVRREEMESAAVVCRIAPSWLRIGNFQIQQTREAWDLLLQLTQFAARQVLHLEGQQNIGKAVLKEVARRNAIMVAAWQNWGFMHGVINTDNVSILGLTIDYGPYAFMDVFERNHICNHSDDMGRYSYQNQPDMVEFAIRKLGDSLGELMGAEEELGELQPGWADNMSKEKRYEWALAGREATNEVIEEYKAIQAKEEQRLFSRRFGLLDEQPEDKQELFDPFMHLMEEHELDYHRTFRFLCQFKGVDDPSTNALLDLMVPTNKVPPYLSETAQPAWRDWLKKFEARISASEQQVGVDASQREARMQAANPRFVLRQWVLEETISRLKANKDTDYLAKVLEMCERPFEPYGEERADGQIVAESDGEKLRLCGVGSADMLGFQCSCSS